MKGLLAQLRSWPADRVLFVRDGRGITAGEIRAAAVRAVARVAAGDGPVFLYTDSAAMLCAGLLAGARLGRVIAVLPHAQPAYLAEVGAEAGSLLTDAGADAPLQLGGANAEISGSDDPGLVFFTSGSTGAPKQAVKQMSQIDAEASFWVEWFGEKANHAAGSVSHQHIYGMLFRVALPVIGGWTSSDAQGFGWEAFAAELGVKSVAVTSPAHLTRIPPGLKAGPAFVLSSGGPLPLAGALEAVEAFGAPPLEILGSTETGGVAIRQRRDDAEPWTMLAPIESRLDCEGVLEVRSSFAGDEWVRMGDRAEMLEGRRFRLLARADRVVKIEGKRVSLARVEEVVKALPGIADVAALGLGAEGAEQLAAVVVLDAAGGSELAKLGAFRFSRELRKRLSAQLEAAERPKRWRFVGRMPANAQGKRVLKDLVALFAGRSMIETLGAKVEKLEGETAEIGFDLDAKLPWLEGHFPGAPILAGVAQVHIAVRLAEDVWGFAPGTLDVSRMKFRRLMPPGGRVTVTLTRDAEKKRLSFAFAQAGAGASEGVVGL
jgi:3-hydroxymyristoyl/3-hydroxydecanoyl-(acyl carrier protein) dehydratase